jgi:hypothetical protein
MSSVFSRWLFEGEKPLYLSVSRSEESTKES